MMNVAAYLVFFLCLALIFGLVCLGLNLQWGFAGLFNVGVVGFFAVGAYAVAILCSPPAADLVGGFNLPVPLGLVTRRSPAARMAASRSRARSRACSWIGSGRISSFSR